MIRIPIISAWLYRRDMRRNAWAIAGRMIADYGSERAYDEARALKRECMRSPDPQTQEMGKMWDGVRRVIGKRAKVLNIDTATRYTERPLVDLACSWFRGQPD